MGWYANWRERRRNRPRGTAARQRTILTAEGLRLPLVLASRGVRAAALMIDLFLVSLAMFLLLLLLIWIGSSIGLQDLVNNRPGVRAVMQVLIIIYLLANFLAPHVWFLAFELGPRGATPGKRITGIRIAARPGRDGAATRLTAEAVIARNLIRQIEILMPIIFIGSAAAAGSDTSVAAWAAVAWFAVFAGFPFFNRDRLRCGDVIAGTWVVETPRRRLAAALSVGQDARGTSTLTGAQYRFSEAELAIYGEYELQVLERVLRDNRPDVLTEVTSAICAKIGWSSGTGDERAFLEAYYTQLRSRLETGMRMGRRKADKFTS